MFKSHSILFWFISISLILVTSTLSADEEYPIDTDEKAKEVASYNWECEWKGNYASGTSTYIHDDDATLNKSTGKVKSSYCPDGWGKFKGNYKKGKGLGKDSNFPAPCEGTVTGKGTFYKAADGSLYTKSTWRHSGGYSKGTSQCKAVPK